MPQPQQADASQIVKGPDGKRYKFPPGTTKDQAVAYFKKHPVHLDPSNDPLGKREPPAPPDASDFLNRRKEAFGESVRGVGADARKALPYAGAGIATALQPEGAGLWMSLASAFGGAAAGQGAEDLLEGKRDYGQEPYRMAAGGLEKGVVQEAGGRAVGWAGRKLYKGTIPDNILSYLKEKGITPTAGERAGPGPIATAENVGSAVAAATDITDKFVTTRQQRLGDIIGDVSNQITGALDSSTSNSMVVREGSPRTSQEVAQQALDRMSSERQMANARLADIGSGRAGMTPAEAGETIIQAVRGTYDAASDVQDATYNKLRPKIQAVPVHYGSSAIVARHFLLDAMQAQKAGGTVLPPELLTSMMRIGGVKSMDDLSGMASEVPVNAFQAAWDARGLVGKMIGRLDAQGVISSKQKGVLQTLYKAMTRDMLNSLTPTERAAFQQAIQATAAVKQTFNNKLLQSMLRTDRPIASEKVFSEVMRAGNEDDLKRLMTVIGGNQDAVTATRRAAVEWLFKNSRNDEHALELLEKRPGLRSVFGAQYDGLRQELASRVQASMSPQQVVEQKFLEKLTQSDPSEVATKALKSPEYAERIAALTQSQPLVHQDIAIHMFNGLVDKSTSNGPYGAPGSFFNPTQFSRNWTINRPTFQRFLAPEVISNIDKVAEAMSKLTFESKPGVAAKFKSLGEMGAMASGAVAVAIGVIKGSPTTVEAGIAVPIAAIYGPRMFVKAVLSPTGSKLLGDGLKIPAGTAEASAWGMRFMTYMGQLALEDANDHKGDRSRSKLPGVKPGEVVHLNNREQHP